MESCFGNFVPIEIDGPTMYYNKKPNHFQKYNKNSHRLNNSPIFNVVFLLWLNVTK